MADYKVRVQLYDDDGNLLGDADVQTTADLVYFADGETFQQKLDSGKLKGATGAAGPAGPIGAAGPAGEKGDTGAAGQRGNRWTVGTAVTGTSDTAAVFNGSGIVDAIVNDMYLNSSTGNVYKCTTGGDASVAKWVYAGNIKGVAGAKGAAGPAGPKGDGIKVGSAYASATEKNIFFKLL